ncbi:hypothetical protein BU26DRAFT_216712 [Trematosphaeria pertusa]|uniref:Uncharacterized protein n=1 Tax=Trematosphaeria pertusa TaxID=390896 RepID=A0A6A6IRI1_9PLEO|nr:uncharacterized protein BU26DRAFT_216712 [Trematosphaeria pertusa]KAF2253165.1 hypothetical protein BU26DRAFT_216712 [Trematosphaeria pertusa]
MVRAVVLGGAVPKTREPATVLRPKGALVLAEGGGGLSLADRIPNTANLQVDAPRPSAPCGAGCSRSGGSEAERARPSAEGRRINATSTGGLAAGGEQDLRMLSSRMRLAPLT